jgi:hypothetical protein
MKIAELICKIFSNVFLYEADGLSKLIYANFVFSIKFINESTLFQSII